jgi:hypothetical protein
MRTSPSLTTTSAALKGGIVTSKQVLEPRPGRNIRGVATRLPIHSPSSDPVRVRPASVRVPARAIPTPRECYLGQIQL